MDKFISRLRSQAERVNAAAADVLGAAGEANLKEVTLSASAGFGFDTVIAKATTLADLTLKMLDKSATTLELLASTSKMTQLKDHFSALADNLEKLKATLDKVIQSGGSSEAANGSITAADGASYDIRPHLDQIVSFVDNALEPFVIIAAAVRPRNVGTFTAASKTLAEKATEASQTVGKLRQQLNQITDEAASASEAHENTISAKKEVERLKADIEADRRSAEEGQQKIAAAMAAMEEERSAAASLANEVSEYRDKFRAFQKELDSREAALEKGNTDLSNMKTALDAQNKKVDDMMEQAGKMLGDATIAGLSSTYTNRSAEVNTQLNHARIAFYASIILLIGSVLFALNGLSALGIVTNLPPISPTAQDLSAGTMAIQTLSSIGSRVLIILPALLLASFSARRHAALFRLREEYSHKAALAASIHGFKEQAPGYEESMAAAVFEELLGNPASSMDGSRATKKSNGFLDKLIRPKVRNALEEMLQGRDNVTPRAD